MSEEERKISQEQKIVKFVGEESKKSDSMVMSFSDGNLVDSIKEDSLEDWIVPRNIRSN